METGMAIPDELAMNKIYFIRGQKVMLDRDLAELYGVETKQLKRQVNRNIERFPEDFMFELPKTEFEIGGANLAPPMRRIKWVYVTHLTLSPSMAF